ncbi:7430_t:CDS:1 [Ambispora leptoticha]|uniref:7430_t:CDS:1 n=1 Tax=Ambispora leptoticha TaxID=144679 RepID=A0A9N8YMH3_9GLOM|nr:7430_t:CDS:1 [Ambispora leptoticha]
MSSALQNRAVLPTQLPTSSQPLTQLSLEQFNNSRNMSEYTARQMQMYAENSRPQVGNALTQISPSNHNSPANSNNVAASPALSSVSLASYDADCLGQQSQQHPIKVDQQQLANNGNNTNNHHQSTPANGNPNGGSGPLPHFEYVSYDRVQVLYEQKKGTLYFIPEGFEPVLVPNDAQAQSVTNLLQSSKQVSAPLNVSRMLPDTDVRLPSLALPCGVAGPQAKPNANNGKSKVKKPPRPPNAFILYRRAKQPGIVAKNQGITNNEVSKEIGRMWHEEPIEVRLKFQKMAEAAKQEHMKKYPEYRYRPRRPQDRKRRIQPRDSPARRGSSPVLSSEKLPMLDNSAFVSSSSSPNPRRVSSISSNDCDNSSELYLSSPTMTHNVIPQQQPVQQNHLQQQLMYANNSPAVRSPQESFGLLDGAAQFNYAYMNGLPNAYDSSSVAAATINSVPIDFSVFDGNQQQTSDECFEYPDFEDYHEYDNMNCLNYMEEEYYRQNPQYIKFDYE